MFRSGDFDFDDVNALTLSSLEAYDMNKNVWKLSSFYPTHNDQFNIDVDFSQNKDARYHRLFGKSQNETFHKLITGFCRCNIKHDNIDFMDLAAIISRYMGISSSHIVKCKQRLFPQMLLFQPHLNYFYGNYNGNLNFNQLELYVKISTNMCGWLTTNCNYLLQMGILQVNGNKINEFYEHFSKIAGSGHIKFDCLNKFKSLTNKTGDIVTKYFIEYKTAGGMDVSAHRRNFLREHDFRQRIYFPGGSPIMNEDKLKSGDLLRLQLTYDKEMKKQVLRYFKNSKELASLPFITHNYEKDNSNSKGNIVIYVPAIVTVGCDQCNNPRLILKTAFYCNDNDCDYRFDCNMNKQLTKDDIQAMIDLIPEMEITPEHRI